MVDHFLSVTPATMTALDMSILGVAVVALLGLCLWLQAAGIRWVDGVLETWDQRNIPMTENATPSHGLWYPNRRQWWALWIGYIVAIVMNGEGVDPGLHPERATVFLVIGIALLVWRLSRSRQQRGW
jgi:hypothetical protein